MGILLLRKVSLHEYVTITYPRTSTYPLFGTPLNTQHFHYLIIHILVLVLYIHTSMKLNGEKQCSSSLDREVGVRHTSCHSPRVCRSGVSNISQSGRHVKRIVSHPRVCRRVNNWRKFDVTWSMSCDWKCDTRIDEANRPLITAGRGRWK